ncbi:hypothetical protein FB45DRAFT_75973 [Roridomyces roridus]|uniref:Uncharacterized protein n=1 Tax=Roridomyces roridus TaxID=1738132 RepID=A0AAD7FIT7_9AGAR|nr:hypothetical protein FB45DRAFT_75973 [Roridomyces roridus]
MSRRPTVQSRMNIHIHGGIGGHGGQGGRHGGGGGNGEGPHVILNHGKLTVNKWQSPRVNHPRSDFRLVRLGDLNLIKEFENGDVVRLTRGRHYGIGECHTEVIGTRTAYSARLFGYQDPLTVVSYEGAFEEVKAQILRSQRYRHPHLMQVFGTVECSGFNAFIYHDGEPVLNAL